jgi:hypothetical protein
LPSCAAGTDFHHLAIAVHLLLVEIHLLLFFYRYTEPMMAPLDKPSAKRASSELPGEVSSPKRQNTNADNPSVPSPSANKAEFMAFDQNPRNDPLRFVTPKMIELFREVKVNLTEFACSQIGNWSLQNYVNDFLDYIYSLSAWRKQGK